MYFCISQNCGFPKFLTFWKRGAQEDDEDPFQKILSILDIKSIATRKHEWSFGSMGVISTRKHKCIFGNLESIKVPTANV